MNIWLVHRWKSLYAKTIYYRHKLGYKPVAYKPVACRCGSPIWQNTESLLSVSKHGNLPYDCIKDTSKITLSIIHKHKYTYIVKHRVLYLWVCRAHTHPKQSTLRVTRVSTCAHRSGIFQQVRKSYKVNPADYISNMTKTCWVCSKPKSSGNVLTYWLPLEVLKRCF